MGTIERFIKAKLSQKGNVLRSVVLIMVSFETKVMMAIKCKWPSRACHMDMSTSAVDA